MTNPNIPKEPNININNNENELEEEQQDMDVHNKDELDKRINVLKQKTKEKIDSSIQNEMYTKDNPVLGSL